MMLTGMNVLDKVLRLHDFEKPEVHSLLPSARERVTGFRGFVPSFRERIKEGLSIKPLNPDLILPAGLEFIVGCEIFLSDKIRTIRDVNHLRSLSVRGDIKQIELGNGKIVLEPSIDGKNIYYIASLEKVHLPNDLSLLVDAKSTSGRLGCMCIDRSQKHLESGVEGPVIVSAQPYAFPIEIEMGKSKLFHAILRYRGSSFMSRDEVLKDEEKVVALFEKDKELCLNDNGRFGKDGLAMTFSAKKALRAKLPGEIPGPVRLDGVREYDMRDYWDVIEGDEEIEMEPKRFYLFGTEERIRLGDACGVLSRENGETGTGLWSHFAGFIWPGYEGPITMECRSESPRVISKGDYAGFVQLDKLETSLDDGEKYSGSYQHQEVPKAPKMFK